LLAVPPVIEAAHSAPDLWRWLINLAWIRRITGRPAPKVPGPEEMGTPHTELIDWQKHEKKGSIDSQSSLVAELPLLGKAQKPDHSNEATEYGQS
jgi:hypothetical protein